MGNTSSKGPFSIAMLVYQGVSHYLQGFIWPPGGARPDFRTINAVSLWEVRGPPSSPKITNHLRFLDMKIPSRKVFQVDNCRLLCLNAYFPKETRTLPFRKSVYHQQIPKTVWFSSSSSLTSSFSLKLAHHFGVYVFPTTRFRWLFCGQAEQKNEMLVADGIFEVSLFKEAKVSHGQSPWMTFHYTEGLAEILTMATTG